MTSLELAKELKKRGIKGYWIGRPSLEELLEVMPETIRHKGILYTLTMSGKFARYEHIDFDKCDIYEIADRTGDNLTEAVAKCLIYLIDNNYCKVIDGEVVVDGV